MLKAIIQKTPSTCIVIWFGLLWLALFLCCLILLDSVEMFLVHLSLFCFVSFYERFVLFCSALAVFFVFVFLASFRSVATHGTLLAVV